MITFFTAAKPFRGEAAIHQRNALRSWLEAAPDGEVLLFGDEEGSAEAAAELGLRHIADVPRNGYGTPMLDAIFAIAQREARHPVLCYANADIIFLPGFATAVARLADWRRFAMIGRRITIEMGAPIDFAAGWADGLLGSLPAVRRHGRGTALDYFVFRRGAVGPLPAFAIGRPTWDNWLVADFRRRGVPVVDATRVVSAIHPRHGYGHVADPRGRRWEGPEADANRALARADMPGFRPELYARWCAGWLMLPHAIVPALTPRRIASRLRARWCETRAGLRAASRRRRPDG